MNVSYDGQVHELINPRDQDLFEGELSWEGTQRIVRLFHSRLQDQVTHGWAEFVDGLPSALIKKLELQVYD